MGKHFMLESQAQSHQQRCGISYPPPELSSASLMQCACEYSCESLSHVQPVSYCMVSCLRITAFAMGADTHIKQHGQ